MLFRSERVGRGARAFWGAAWKEAQAGLQGERDTLDVARRDLARERQDMAAEIRCLEAENGRQADELDRLRDTLAKAEQGQQDAKEAAQGLRVDNARLDERVKSAEALGLGLQGELDKLHARFQEVAAKVAG